MGNLDMFDYNKQVCKEAVEVFGRDAQITKAIEECAELIQVLAKYKNKYMDPSLFSDEEKAKILDEVVDVSIMLEQVKIMFDLDEEVFSKHKESKINRLQLRLLSEV